MESDRNTTHSRPKKTIEEIEAIFQPKIINPRTKVEENPVDPYPIIQLHGFIKENGAYRAGLIPRKIESYLKSISNNECDKQFILNNKQEDFLRKMKKIFDETLKKEINYASNKMIYSNIFLKTISFTNFLRTFTTFFYYREKKYENLEIQKTLKMYLQGFTYINRNGEERCLSLSALASVLETISDEDVNKFNEPLSNMLAQKFHNFCYEIFLLEPYKDGDVSEKQKAHLTPRITLEDLENILLSNEKDLGNASSGMNQNGPLQLADNSFRTEGMTNSTTTQEVPSLLQYPSYWNLGPFHPANPNQTSEFKQGSHFVSNNNSQNRQNFLSSDPPARISNKIYASPQNRPIATNSQTLMYNQVPAHEDAKSYNPTVQGPVETGNSTTGTHERGGPHVYVQGRGSTQGGLYSSTGVPYNYPYQNYGDSRYPTYGYSSNLTFFPGINEGLRKVEKQDNPYGNIWDNNIGDVTNSGSENIRDVTNSDSENRKHGRDDTQNRKERPAKRLHH